MIVQQCSRHLTLPVTALLAGLVLMLAPITLLASDRDPGQPHATNVDWVMDGEQMVISYDLIGEANTRYVVDLALRRRGDPEFRVVPVHVIGDVGEGKFAGPGRVVRWQVAEDLGGLPKGDDFLVEVLIDEPSELPWFLVVVGVAVTSATVYSLVQNGEEVGPPPISELPAPPARP